MQQVRKSANAIIATSRRDRHNADTLSRRYILVDACVAAAAYAPSTTRSSQLSARSKTLFSRSSTQCDPQFLIPNFCIGETFAVFEKYRWGASWNRHLGANTRLTPHQFQTSRDEFHTAIHNGTKLLQVELNRYHILCMDLIAPINAASRIKRDRGARKNVSPASTYDLLLIAMGIWLQKEYGHTDFVIATGDERVSLITKRAKSVKLARAMKKHLSDVAEKVGLTYGPCVYPTVVDLIRCKKAALESAFPSWQPAW